MAESANVRQNLQNNPSIFEISASETLDNLIYPALNKIFDYFGLRLDFKLWGTIRINEELSPVVTFVLQYLYLRNRGASFGESFYGMQRRDKNTGELISRPKQLLSASFLTFVPYLERRLKSRSANHEDTYKWEKYVLKAMHVLNSLNSVHTFLYLIKYTTNHSPLFQTMGLTLRYPPGPQKDNKTTVIFLKVLEVLAFFLQFIQWWYSNDQRGKVGGSLKNPPPIKKSVTEIQNGPMPHGDCPICLMKMQTPTVCAVSGYVYCWKCIIAHLKNELKCPISGYSITIGDLVRIYDE